MPFAINQSSPELQLRFLSNKIPWFGRYSGYECLPDYLPKQTPHSIYQAKKNFLTRIVGKLFQLKNGWQGVKPEDIYAELQFSTGIDERSISHILYLENHIHLLENKLKSRGLLATIHIPAREWKQKNLELLANLKNAIILYDEDTDKFSKYIDVKCLHVIRHGVDTDFFHPGNSQKINKNKILFAGHYLRDFNMFLNVYKQIKNHFSDDIEYHFIIPPVFRTDPVLGILRDNKNIFFHENLSDEELLEHYQTSYLLLMPMINSGANTAIIQALSTGLPVLTTDVGGIRSYGGSEIFPIIRPDDALGMTELFVKYFQDENYRHEISNRQRAFSLEYLNWPTIVNEHLLLYNSILQTNAPVKHASRLKETSGQL